MVNMNDLQELRSYRETLLNTIVRDHSDLERLMSGGLLIDVSEHLTGLNDQYNILMRGESLASSDIRQKESVLHYKICDCEESIELITNGRLAQEHLLSLARAYAELESINEKIKCLEHKCNG